MIVTNLLMCVMLGGVTQPDSKEYWQGYAAGVLAQQCVKSTDIIHEGKPKPSKDKEPVKAEPTPKKPEPTPATTENKKPEVDIKEALAVMTKYLEANKPKAEARPWEKPPYPLPPPPIPEGDKKVVPPTPAKKVEPPKPVVQQAELPTTYKGAVQYAKDNNCQVLLLFGSKSCGPCHALQRNTIENKTVREAMTAHNIGLIFPIDCDDYSSLADAYHVTSMPWYTIIDGNKIVKSGRDYKTPEQFIEWMDK